MSTVGTMCLNPFHTGRGLSTFDVHSGRDVRKVLIPFIQGGVFRHIITAILRIVIMS